MKIFDYLFKIKNRRINLDVGLDYSNKEKIIDDIVNGKYIGKIKLFRIADENIYYVSEGGYLLYSIDSYIGNRLPYKNEECKFHGDIFNNFCNYDLDIDIIDTKDNSEEILKLKEEMEQIENAMYPMVVFSEKIGEEYSVYEKVWCVHLWKIGKERDCIIECASKDEAINKAFSIKEEVLNNDSIITFCVGLLLKDGSDYVRDNLSGWKEEKQPLKFFERINISSKK